MTKKNEEQNQQTGEGSNASDASQSNETTSNTPEVNQNDGAGESKKPPTQPETKKKKTEKVLKVVSSREGFRRAGHRFGKEPVTLRLDDLTDEQIAMLKAESMLVVTETTQ
ncbi:MAG: hypothetical protein H6937_08975 [Burkholderiales bacterium]|nr:hypothetical protein [Burkholderiales bacterium]